MDDLANFKEKMIEDGTSPDKVEEAISTLNEFNNFLNEKNKSMLEFNEQDFYDFSHKLIEEEKNTILAYETIIRFGHFTNNQNLILLGREVLDGKEVMENLSKRLKEEYSKEFRDEIFEELDVPPLGLDPKIKPDYTKKLIGRLVKKIGEKESEKFLAKGLRDSYYEWRKPDRKLFLESKNIDEFLKEKRKRQIKALEKYRDEGTLYFTQPINDEAVEYVKNDPRIEIGVRDGNIIRAIKIPHETIKFLNEKDEKMKAYYYCHCPYAKEAIKDGTSDEIPAVFCNCSGGYYKNYWEIVLDQPIDVKTVETVLKGDPYCLFEIHLPEDVVEGLD